MEAASFVMSGLSVGLIAWLHFRLIPKTSFRKSGVYGVVLDTSSLIDGRVESVIDSGFIHEAIHIPQAVLDELQMLADGRDTYKRDRARTGLELLARLQQSNTIGVYIAPRVKSVDTTDMQVLECARKQNMPLCTTDYALLQRAQANGVKTMNINELAEGLRESLKLGDVVKLTIAQHGEFKQQGVGHSADGTLIVVEDGGSLLGETISVRIKKVTQTKSGRMVFARVVRDMSSASNAA